MFLSLTKVTKGLEEVQEYDVNLDDSGRQIKMCKRDCSCHQGARYDQIECRCEWYCGDEINE